jgi:hypothetical protein
MLVILASLVQSAISLKIFERNEVASRYLDRASFIGCGLTTAVRVTTWAKFQSTT